MEKKKNTTHYFVHHHPLRTVHPEFSGARTPDQRRFNQFVRIKILYVLYIMYNLYN